MILLTTTLMPNAAPKPAVPAPDAAPAGAVTTEMSVAVRSMVPKASTVELFEMWASIVLTTTLSDTEPPTAKFPAKLPDTVNAVTTANEEAANSTSPADEVTTAPSM